MDVGGLLLAFYSDEINIYTLYEVGVVRGLVCRFIAHPLYLATYYIHILILKRVYLFYSHTVVVVGVLVFQRLSVSIPKN